MTSKKPLCFHAVHEFFVVVSFPWGTFCTEACRHGGATKKSCLSGGCSLEYLNSPPKKSFKKLHNFEPRKTGKHRQMFFCPILVMFFFFLRDALAYIFYELLMQEEGGIGEYNRANRSLGHFVENSAGRKVGTCCANACTKNDETIWKHE